MLNSNEIIVLQHQQDALREARQQKLVQEALSGRATISLYQRVETWLESVLSRRIAAPISARETQKLNPKTRHAS